MTASPAAGDRLVFLGSDGQIEGRARSDGSVQWRKSVPGRVTSLYWDSGWLLADISEGTLVALRAVDGETLWQRALGAAVHGSPAASGDRLYVPLRDGRIAALSLTTGDEIWTKKLTEAAVGILPVGERVFVGARDNHFYALETQDGDVDWKWQAGADILGMPAVDERRVYFVALDHVLRGHNRSNGSMIWKRVLPMRPFTGPIRVGDVLLVAGIASDIRAFRAADGEDAGSFELKGEQGEEVLLASPPYLSAEGAVVLVTKGGQVRLVASGPAASTAPPAGVAPSDKPAAPGTPAAPDAPTDAPAAADAPAAPGKGP